MEDKPVYLGDIASEKILQQEKEDFEPLVTLLIKSAQKGLMQTSIDRIVSDKIKARLQNKFPGIKINSSDSYQGSVTCFDFKECSKRFEKSILD